MYFRPDWESSTSITWKTDNGYYYITWPKKLKKKVASSKICNVEVSITTIMEYVPISYYNIHHNYQI